MAKYKQHEDTYKIARCPVCGKIFDVEFPQLYVYKIRTYKNGDKYNYYCCWTHYLEDSDNRKNESHYLVKLKDVLYKLDLGVSDCANICDISNGSIYRYAELESRATMPVIRRIARSLGVQPEELYDKK